MVGLEEEVGLGATKVEDFAEGIGVDESFCFALSSLISAFTNLTDGTELVPTKGFGLPSSRRASGAWLDAANIAWLCVILAADIRSSIT